MYDNLRNHFSTDYDAVDFRKNMAWWGDGNGKKLRLGIDSFVFVMIKFPASDKGISREN